MGVEAISLSKVCLKEDQEWDKIWLSKRLKLFRSILLNRALSSKYL